MIRLPLRGFRDLGWAYERAASSPQARPLRVAAVSTRTGHGRGRCRASATQARHNPYLLLHMQKILCIDVNRTGTKRSGLTCVTSKLVIGPGPANPLEDLVGRLQGLWRLLGDGNLAGPGRCPPCLGSLA